MGTLDIDPALEAGSRAFFDEVRRRRYEVHDRWMLRDIPFRSAAGKRVLEIGHGLGIDLMTFQEAGALVHGIDITPRHHELAKRHFALRGADVDLRLCDAANICHPDATFDIVYSHGVLHHTSSPEQCLREAWRVLRPGGRIIFTVYHRMSAFHLWRKCFWDGILGRQLWKLGYQGLMATVEAGADGLQTRPLVRTFSVPQVRRMARGSGFTLDKVFLAHLEPGHVHPFDRLASERALMRLERTLGWYVVVFATKQHD